MSVLTPLNMLNTLSICLFHFPYITPLYISTLSIYSIHSNHSKYPKCLTQYPIQFDPFDSFVYLPIHSNALKSISLRLQKCPTGSKCLTRLKCLKCTKCMESLKRVRSVRGIHNEIQKEKAFSSFFNDKKREYEIRKELWKYDNISVDEIRERLNNL